MFFGRKDQSRSASSYSFTDEVRYVLAHAREEANRLRHEYVGTEHILLALLDEEDGTGTAVLNRIDVRAHEIRRLLDEVVKKGTAPVPGSPELPYTSRSKKVLELAMTAARNLGDGYVGSEHLLLGLINEGRGIAAQVLVDLGATAERTATAVMELRGQIEAEARPRFQFEIDDSSRNQSIYEQLVAQTKEGVATGKLQPNDRLPTVRQLAEVLNIAPGTVARAYGELERLGVVVTEGKRGTRVAPHERPAIPEHERPAMLVGLLRPVAVAAFHLGATAQELRDALDAAMSGIFSNDASP
jgi:DNA-binding transcriptional regulator YhcF (GntR family)